MSRLESRLKALERQAKGERLAGRFVTVWRQDPAGADRFTSVQHPDMVLTRAQLDDLPSPEEETRIVVHRVEPTADALRRPGERF